MLVSIKKWGNSQGLIIPKHILDSLAINIGDELTMNVEDEAIVLKKANKNYDDFSDLILKDLIEEGYSGQELYQEFIKMKENIGHAYDQMAMEAYKDYKEGRTYSLEEAFDEWNKII